LFRGVDTRPLGDIVARFERRLLPPGEVILSPGEINSSLYGLISGRMLVHLTSVEGGPLVALKPGECVGEISLLDGQPASALVTTDTECDVVVIDQGTLWALIDRSGEVARNLLYTLSQRLRNNNALVTSAWRQRRDLEDKAQRDPLTGLLNRRGLEDALSRLVERCRLEGTPFALLVIDVDDFKSFNDRYGHAAGDRVLSAIGAAISQSLRPSDLAARYGGDEMVVGLVNASAEQGRLVAERIRRAAGRIRLGTARAEPRSAPTLSVGVAQLAPGQDAETLFRTADEALYAAKTAGRDRIAFA
jgi:diguanylate cyclase (GGDEF)-like protein